jgi:hypothetical protein
VRRALPLLERVVADGERFLGADHPDTLAFRNNLAGAYHEAGQTRRVLPLLERVVADGSGSWVPTIRTPCRTATTGPLPTTS